MPAFAAWRSRLHDEPSPQRFRQLCWMGLEVAPEDFQLIWLPYALEHLRSWPDHARVAPLDIRLHHAIMDPTPCAVLQMIARLVMPPSVDAQAWLKAVLASDQLSHLRLLELDCRGSTHPLEGHDIVRLAQWSGLARLRALSLTGHGLTDDDLAPLLESPDVASLEQLDLSSNHATAATLERLANRTELMPLRSLRLEQAAITLNSLQTLIESPQGSRLETLHVEPVPGAFLARIEPKRSRPWRGLGLIELSDEDEPGMLVDSGALSAMEEVCVQVEGSWSAWPVLSLDATPNMQRLSVSCRMACDIVLDPGLWRRWVRSSRLDERLSQLSFDLEPEALGSNQAIVDITTTWLRLLDGAPTILRIHEDDIKPPWRPFPRRLPNNRLVLQWLSLDRPGVCLADASKRMAFVGIQRGQIDPRVYQTFASLASLEWSTARVKVDNLSPILRSPWWPGLEALTLSSFTGDAITQEAWELLLQQLRTSRVRHLALRGFQWPSGMLERLMPNCRALETLELQLGSGWQHHQLASLLATMDGATLRRLGLRGIPQTIPDGMLLLMLDINLPNLTMLDLSGRCWHPSTLAALVEGFTHLDRLLLTHGSYTGRLEWADDIEARFPVVWADRPEFT